MNTDHQQLAYELLVRHLNYSDTAIWGAFISGWVTSMSAGLWFASRRLVEDAD